MKMAIIELGAALAIDDLRGYSATHMIMDVWHHMPARRNTFHNFYVGWAKETAIEYADQQPNWHKEPKTYYAAKKNADKPQPSALLLSLVALSVPS